MRDEDEDVGSIVDTSTTGGRNANTDTLLKTRTT